LGRWGKDSAEILKGQWRRTLMIKMDQLFGRAGRFEVVISNGEVLRRGFV